MLAGTIPAAQLAVNRINNNRSILPNHYLQLATANDSMVSFLLVNSRWACLIFFPSHPKCNADGASDEYLRFWTNNLRNQTAPIFLGAGCSLATEPMLTAGRFWRTMQVHTNSRTYDMLYTCYALQHMQNNVPSLVIPTLLS